MRRLILNNGLNPLEMLNECGATEVAPHQVDSWQSMT